MVKEADRRTSVTVLATSNDVWQAYLSGVPGASAKPSLVADTLRYQILLTYFSPLELSKIPLKNGTSVTTLLQTTGRTNDTAGGGTVELYNTGKQILIGHFTPDSYGNETVIANITKSPFSYSVLQISSVLIPLTPLIPAPLPAPTLAPAPSAGLGPSPFGSPPSPPVIVTPGPSSPPEPSYASMINVRVPLTLMVVFLVSMAVLL